MSKLNINSDLFLGEQELNRWQKFIIDDGFVRNLLNNAISFGLVHKNISDGNWTNFLVQQGTNTGTLKINSGTAIDKNGNVIIWPETDNISLTDDNQWRWIKIKYQIKNYEDILVSVSKNGDLNMPNGNLTDILRGIPNNPVLVKFSNATLNTQTYQVLEVIDDNNAILSGSFQAENNLQLAVVGAFTPDAVVPEESKYPYKYDYCTTTLVLESTLNVPPTLLEDEEFLIARVKRNGSSIFIQDKRLLNIFKTKASYELSPEIASDNPLIGVEAIKYANNLTPRDENLLYISWTFRSSNWTIDSSTNRCTLITGLGGKFKSTSDFSDGNFDGWRLYTKDGNYSIIKQSTTTAGQINLILDSIDVDRFSDTSQTLIVAPNSEQIELIFTADPDDNTDLLNKRVVFNISNGQVIVPLVVYKSPSCQYNFKYRYKNYKTYTQETAIPSDSVGYLVENDFDVNGVQTAGVRQAYTSHATDGFITLSIAPNAYSTRLNSIETGDIFGISYVELDNLNPIFSLNVGSSRQVQKFITKAIVDGGLGSPYTLAANHYIDLRTDAASIKNGNSFILQFSTQYVKGAFNIYITEDYVNSGNPGTIKYTFKESDFKLAAAGYLNFECRYDGTEWYVKRVVHLDSGGAVVEDDLNKIDVNGFYYADASASNRPSSSNGYFIHQIYPLDSTYASQLYILSTSSDKAFFRRKVAGVWGSWIELANASDYVPNSRNVIAGTGLSGGGTLGSDITFNANVDSSSIEVSGDIIRLPNGYKALQSSDGNVLLTKKFTFSWNMDSDSTKLIPHGGINQDKIIFAKARITDTLGTRFNLELADSGSQDASIARWDSSDIYLFRRTGGFFDSAQFNSVSGILYLFYEP